MFIVLDAVVYSKSDASKLPVDVSIHAVNHMRGQEALQNMKSLAPGLPSKQGGRLESMVPMEQKVGLITQRKPHR